MWLRGNTPAIGRTRGCFEGCLGLLILLAGMLAGGCAPKKMVYLPHDWHASPPVPRAQPDTPAGEPQEHARAKTPLTVGKPILSPPKIRESELPSGSKSGSSVEIKPVPGAGANHGSPQNTGPTSGAVPAGESGSASSSGDTPKSPLTVEPPSGQSHAPASQPPAKRTPLPDKEEAATPQHYASMHLVDQARASLGQGKPDAAIPVYEQAVQVDAYNGEAFLGLAKAWRMKGADAKSLEFAKKAEILLQDKPSRLKEVYLLQADIHKRAGNTSQMKACMQKASRL